MSDWPMYFFGGVLAGIICGAVITLMVMSDAREY